MTYRDERVRPRNPKRRSVLLIGWLGLVTGLVAGLTVTIWTVNDRVRGNRGWTCFLLSVVVGIIGLALALNWDNDYLEDRFRDD